jgi:cellulose biosynthesis protein BcsQ
MKDAGNKIRNGTVFTFYSFKGGTGRSMALANVATLLARWGRKVLVVDWDLEAPGIELFFAEDKHQARMQRASTPGITDLIQSQAKGELIDWRSCVVSYPSGVQLISAGRDNGAYADKLRNLDFDFEFREHKLGEYIESLRREWISEFEFVLVDSRTGVTDIGGICTVHLPDFLVLFFTATEASVDGALEVVRRARDAQESSPLERGRLVALPVPSRDESRSEYARALEWKKVFAERFADLYNDWLPKEVSPLEAVEWTRIPYVPYWSFGEPLPVVDEGASDPASLGFSYEILARLVVTRLDWYEAVRGAKLPPPPPIRIRDVDDGWINKNRRVGSEGLKNAGLNGAMEIFHICLDSPINRAQSELLEIADQSAVHTFGWPIGVVLHRDDARPRPTSEGIVATIKSSDSFDYWTLNKNGDFYTLISLFEDSRGNHDKMVLYFDTRLVRTTEAIMHCINLYRAMGVAPKATVQLTIRYVGLAHRTLRAASPNRYFTSRVNLFENEVATTVRFQVGAEELEIVALVKDLCDPLFVLFDFASVSDPVYREYVSGFLKGQIPR